MVSKVFIIGIDGGTWDMLTPAMEQGYMPHLKAMTACGCYGNLRSTTPPKTPAAWSAFQTGLNPGATGVFDFICWDKTEKKASYVSANSLPKTIWQIAGDAGKKICAINVPMTYPPKEINGCMVTGILTPSRESDFTWPRQLKSQLLSAVPDYHIFDMQNIKAQKPHKDPKSFIRQMASIIDNRAKAAEFIIDKYPSDLFMVHFQASDIIQHVMWGYMCNDHPYFDPDIRDYIFENFYRPLDEKIHHLHQTFKQKNPVPNVTFIISDHGFQSHYKRFNLGNWLVRQGWLKIKNEEIRFSAARNFLDKTNMLGLRKLVTKSKSGRKLDQYIKQPNFSFDWSKSTAYSFSRGNDGFIYLLGTDENLRKQTEEHLRDKLSQITDPENNNRIVEKIYSSNEIFHGPKMHLMPDIIVKPAPGYTFTGDYSHSSRELFAVVTKENDFHIGTHHADGILIAAGENIRKQSEISNAGLLDMAPTILTCLGLPIPSQMDGSVLQEMFDKTVQPEYKNETEAPSSETKPHSYSEGDVNRIERRLRDLGYLE